MRLVLIGCDDELLATLLSADLPKNSRITAFCGPQDRRRLQAIGCDVHPLEQWMSALNLRDVRVFVVANDPPPMEQLRFLAQSGQPILVTHPACSMIEGFELQMIQADTLAAIQPFFGGINHPLLDVLCHWRAEAAESPIGAVKQLAIQRPLPATDRATVLDAFAKDALVLRRLLAKIDRVNAIGVESLDQVDWSHLSVQMTGTQGLLGRWTTVPEAAGQRARLDVIGERGTAAAALDDDPAAWTLTQNSPHQQSIPLPRWEGSTELLERFCGPQPHPLTTRDWEDACRATELVDAVEQSCRRGKTINIHHVQHTEEATFKSVMAAGGCLLLLATLGILILLQAIQTMRPGIAEWSGWSVFWRLLFLILFGFLALQLLRLVFRRAESS